MSEKRRDYLADCHSCSGQMSVSEGYYGETLAWFYHHCQDCGYSAEGELTEDETGKTEMKTIRVSSFVIGQRVNHYGKNKTIVGFTPNGSAILSPTSSDGNGNPVYTAVLVDDIRPSKEEH